MGRTSTPTRDVRGTGAPATPWHALGTEEVAAQLGVDLDRGLTAEESRRRLDAHGPNELTAEEQRSDLSILLAQFTSPLIAILLVALVVTLLIDEHVDAAVIAAVLVINAVIGFVQERRADRSVNALMALAAPSVRAVRDGRDRVLDARELVPGDVVLLQSGDLVPADLRLAAANLLTIDEALLTGESEPAVKRTDPVEADLLAADRTSIAHMGSVVTSGRGRGLVVATATETELGRIAEDIRTEARPVTPLQHRMSRFANVVAVAVLASTVAAFALGLAMGGAADEMFLTAVALAVAVVPEGLPVAFTVAMALGVHRMARRNVIIRSLPAVETLGSTDTIGSDKTGTLTQNRMTVRRIWTPDGWHDVPAGDRRLDEPDPEPLADTLRTAVLSNESDVLRHVRSGQVTYEHRGDPTETALLEAAYVLDIDVEQLRREAQVVHEIPFEPDRRYSAVVVREGDEPVLRLKGAPERVLELCTGQATERGEEPLDRDAALAAAHEMAEHGLRVLAMARGCARSQTHPDGTTDPGALTLTGLVGMHDPPRPGVVDAIAVCRRAGIRVVMITGDHAATARAIARELGIGRGSSPAVLEGRDVDRMSDDELRARVLEVDVFARVAPEHKLRIVTELRSHDQVVAVTGDGVNDGPALRAADIGIAMGRDGTDVAREASDMVLVDDDFVSIANAVEEGRVVFDNVRKVTYFLLSTGVAAIVAILASIAAGLPLPYVPAALLWLNVVTNGLQDVALAFERGEPDVLDRPPRARREAIVTPLLWERTLLLGVVMAIGSLWLFTWASGAGLDDAQQRGAALTTLVVAMAVHAGNARSERRSLFAVSPLHNRFLAGAVVASLAIHVGASYWGPTRSVLQIAPVTAAGWLRIGVVVVAVVVASELHKWVRSRREVGPWTGPRSQR